MRISNLAVAATLVVSLLVPETAGAETATERFADSDNGCANLAGAYVSKTENDPSNKGKLAHWTAACNRHPFHGMCVETSKEILEARHFTPLKCIQPSD